MPVHHRPTRRGARLLLAPLVALALLGPAGAVVADTSRPVLSEGSRDPAVIYLQERLGLRPDGLFGPSTVTALKAFQRAHGLPDDAVVGRRTWEALATGYGRLGDGNGEVPAESLVKQGQPTATPTARDAAGRYSLGPVKAHVQVAADALGARFRIGVIGGYRESALDPGGHPSGLALDLMVPTLAQGDALAAYAQANAGALGVAYIMWNHRIWNVTRAAEGWRPVSDRGSPTANHEDHVHINFTPTPGGAATDREAAPAAHAPAAGWSASAARTGTVGGRQQWHGAYRMGYTR